MVLSSASELIDRLVSKYESFEFYEDNGIIVCGENIDEFMTHYKKPGKLCFEFSDFNSENFREFEYGFSKLVLNKSKLKIKRFFDEEALVINSALKSWAQSVLMRHYALGIIKSGFQKKPTIHGIKNPVLKDDEIYNDRACFIIVGDLISSRDIELTIDIEEQLLRRVRLKEWFRELEKKKIADGTPELETLPFSTEIHYKIVSFNEPPDSLFNID